MIQLKKHITLLDELHHLQANGLPKGLEVGIPVMDQFIRYAPGTTTDILGYPFSGKSLLFRDIIIRLCKKHNQRAIIHAPDDGQDALVMSEYITALSGKTFEKGYRNTITPKEVTKWASVLSQYIEIVSDFDPVNPLEFWEYASKNGYSYAGLDSWNVLSHKGSIKDPDYIAPILLERNRICRSTGLHAITVHHPKSPGTVKDGKIQSPMVFDFYGGSEVNNKGNNIIIIHKYDKSDYKEPYEITIPKVKPKSAGKVGQVEITYDYPNRTFGYYERQEAKTFEIFEEPKQDTPF